MKTDKIKSLILIPLIFGACNSQESQNLKPQQELHKAILVAKPSSSNSKNGVNYTSKSIIIEQGMLHIKGFMGTLKPTLRSALSQDNSGVTAMGACSTMATQLTNDYNKITNGVKVRRTALKYRNPDNKPDSTDKEVMYRLQAVNDGKPVAVDMGDKYRVYKPLKMKASCLACHGENISPKIKTMIQKKYPHDLAIGFKAGEFRGAVVAEIKK